MFYLDEIFCYITAAPEPFDNSKYRATEYYNYNDMSFYDIDNDMAPMRLPQQSKFKTGHP